MPQVVINLDDRDYALMEKYAKRENFPNVAEALKELFFETLEDESDWQSIREYEEKKARGEMTFYTLEEVEKSLGLDDV